MEPPKLIQKLPSLANECLLIGQGHKADVVWTRAEFIALCEHMLNDNDEHFFMLPYVDANGRSCFAKAKTARAHHRMQWAWQTITGQAKKRGSIGFYPRNAEGKSRWGAMDFDSHDGNELRARGLALAAFQLLRNHPDNLFLVLATSGSAGWHLFIFSREFYSVDEWIKLLKQVAAMIGSAIQKGECEIFPSDTRGRVGYGIRAPGAWNPKHDTFSLIAFENVSSLCLRRSSVLQREIKETPLSYKLTNRVKGAQLTYSEEVAWYRGENDEWRERFAITAPRTRHEKTIALIGHVFHQVSYEVAAHNATCIYNEATIALATPLDEHLAEFDELWKFKEREWLAELSPSERSKFVQLANDNERAAFRIIRSFSKDHRHDGCGDFYIHCESLMRRLHMKSVPGVSKLRVKFCRLGILDLTQPFIPHKLAARFKWIAHTLADTPF